MFETSECWSQIACTSVCFYMPQKMKLEVVDLQQKLVAIVNNSSIVLKASEIALCFAANSTKWKIIHLRVTFAISESLIFEHNRKWCCRCFVCFWMLLHVNFNESTTNKSTHRISWKSAFLLISNLDLFILKLVFITQL